MSKTEANHILVAGFAQLPKGTPIFELLKSIGCILIINPETDIVEKATFTFIQDLTNEFAASLVIGRSITKDMDQIIKDFEEKLLIPPQKATIQAFVAARNRYLEDKK